MWLRLVLAIILCAFALLFFNRAGSVSPDLDLILFVLGAFSVYTEFLLPGTVVPGVFGSVLMLIALSALSRYPLRARSAVWLVGALLLILVQAEFATEARYRICAGFAAAAAFCLVTGEMTLIDREAAEKIHLATAAFTGIPFALITSFL